LVVNLPQGISNLAVSSSFGTSYTATMEGFMLPVALAVGHSGQVTIAFNVGAVQPGTLDATASVSEVGGSGEVLSNVYFTRIPLAPCTPPTPGPTLTPTPRASSGSMTPTPTPTENESNESHTPTPGASGGGAVVPPSMTPVVPPSMTPVVPPSMTPVVITKTVIRYQTLTRYRTLYRTVVRFKTVVRRRVVQTVHVVVHHRVVVKYVTRVRVRTVVRHRTIISFVRGVRVIRHPKTGHFADLPGYSRGGSEVRWALPKPDAYISVPHLGIWSAPIWTRGYVDDGYGGITYDIVPYYGVTRFAYSVPFGVPGTTMVYGHDDINGSIFRYLALLRPGDVVQVATAHHHFTYVVRSVSTVSPTDVGMLTVPRARSTLALISCTPYGVDSQRVVVIAQTKR
jgi:LPXTG-site transpeptidase (sortase) family protein